jgi:phasin family protein
MLTADDVFLLEVPRSGQVFGPDGRSDCCSANVLFTNGFQAACAEREQSFRIRVGGRSFQKIKQPLHMLRCLALIQFICAMHKILDSIVRCTKPETFREVGPPGRSVRHQSGKDSMMVKVEDIQQYGKEQLETAVASAATLQNGIQAIASAYGDYTKKSFEDTRSFVEKLSGVKSLDKAMEVQTEYAKSAYETFVAESQKIAGLYSDLAKQTFKPLEGMVAKFVPAAH